MFSPTAGVALYSRVLCKHLFSSPLSLPRSYCSRPSRHRRCVDNKSCDYKTHTHSHSHSVSLSLSAARLYSLLHLRGISSSKFSVLTSLAAATNNSLQLVQLQITPAETLHTRSPRLTRHRFALNSLFLFLVK